MTKKKRFLYKENIFFKFISFTIFLLLGCHVRPIWIDHFSADTLLISVRGGNVNKGLSFCQTMLMPSLPENIRSQISGSSYYILNIFFLHLLTKFFPLNVLRPLTGFLKLKLPTYIHLKSCLSSIWNFVLIIFIFVIWPSSEPIGKHKKPSLNETR